MNTSPLLVEETNLSDAWCKVLDHIIKSPGIEITPLVLTLTGFDEIAKIREVLDSDLKRNKCFSIRTVSETIFPESLYQFCEQDRHCLYEEYLNNLNRLKKIEPLNNRGTYFERLIAFDGKNKKINQLEIIITSLQSKTVKRRSKLQASIFDPDKDHTTMAYQGFPCLQHVTFYVTSDGGLILNSFYAIQYVYKKAYGNWLGLINLGKFIANELGLKFERFICYVGVEHLDDITKTGAKKILEMTK